MRYFSSPGLRKRAAGLAALLLAGAAFAQGGVRADVAPLPAEERHSIGAVVLMESPVLAQRELALQARESRTGMRLLGRESLRVTQRALMREALDEERALDAARLRQEGARSLIAR